ncbi:hypothetical protein FKM82_026995 [Ascaphus truei]
MSLVTHTLSSVACQVREAAWEVACVLEEQSQNLYREGSRLSFISQVVDIHMEKASRLKIGKLTIPRRPHQAQKIQTNEIQAQRTQYTRNPIHFTSLDHIGRGITVRNSVIIG